MIRNDPFEMFQEEFSEQCLPFDCEAAREYGSIVAARNRQGHPISVENAQIAAIARTNGLSLATRNAKDFSGIEGVNPINPWSD